MKNKPTPKPNAEELRFQNEFLKMKIQAESGAQFHKMDEDGPDLPPEIENEFLENILRFEESFRGANDVMLYDYIGKPEYKKAESISDENIKDEIKYLVNILNENYIFCDCIAPFDDREFYTFLTEELFNEKIPDVRIPGMNKVYIYDEFHPNHEFDTERRSRELLNDYFDNDTTRFTKFYKPAQLVNYNELLLFRESFHEIRNLKFEFISFEHVENNGTRKFHISFDGVVSPGLPPVHYNSEGIIKLECYCNWWEVVFMQIPGMLGK